MQFKKIFSISAVICWRKQYMFVVKDKQYSAKDRICFSLFFSASFCLLLPRHTGTHTNTKCKIASQFFISYGDDCCCVYFRYSILEYRHIYHDLIHLILLTVSQTSALLPGDRPFHFQEGKRTQYLVTLNST